ncbi:unnamed protein product [Schistosoma margrebowiei]|uniref:Uncharacterized protein n=1 Tax=Schistosoma margrebowiei TaxID=48269 RepID=A0A183LY21_9TREM|nr:unnamed protein product [Schistosoma margrebowiei]
MEPSRPKKKRNTKEYITPYNGDRYGKNEQQLERIRKEGLRQGGLENCGRQPMLRCGGNRRKQIKLSQPSSKCTNID